MDRFTLMQCYVRAVETGSFSVVARELSTTQPTVSKNIAALEAHLGARLLYRSSRKMSLTPEGESYYAECRRILDAVAEAESGARGQNTAAGLLRVACPAALARHRVMPLIRPFTEKHPEVCIELVFSNHDIDLIEEGLDIAFRIGRLQDSSYRARLVATYALCCAASPDYLQRKGTPATPADLLQHNCVMFTRNSTGPIWQLGDEAIRPQGNLRVDNPDGLRVAALSGLGIVVAPTWLFADELHDGRLVCLLEAWPIQALPVHMIYPAKGFLPTRARVFMDFVVDEFSRDPCLNGEAVTELGLDPCIRAFAAPGL
ncbi:LysR family transcriptional regulator [Hydrocarboniphaga sp.]|uniref:LysR family transcriptional regulator n=1 Tax=Hydrocarboniphaga sp. TaxID=2033016 RepID=UPI003D1246FC